MAPHATVIGVVTLALRPTKERILRIAPDPRERARLPVESGSMHSDTRGGGEGQAPGEVQGPDLVGGSDCVGSVPLRPRSASLPSEGNPLGVHGESGGTVSYALNP